MNVRSIETTLQAGVALRSPAVRPGLLRHPRGDAIFLLLGLLHGAVLIAVPSLPAIAIGLWWNSNTISHNFIHSPFFHSRGLNRLFSLYLTALLGVPQSIWKARHLAHHADRSWRLRITRGTAIDLLVVSVVWSILLTYVPDFFLIAYLPGYAIGLVLCAIHGHFEHAAGTTSHYGALYNWLFFNDGYHVEHHASPGTHWTKLPDRADLGGIGSGWPAVLRWLDWCSLDSLERLVLRSVLLQNYVLRCHERAFRRVLPSEQIDRVAIVGGGLFPRTAIILSRLLPHARLVVIDASAENLRAAERLLPESIERVEGFYDPEFHTEFDLVVLPLALIGDRERYYGTPAARCMLIHDWLWRRRGKGSIVSWLLLKRLNLVRREGGSPAL